jgi:hypothetical protein
VLDSEPLSNPAARDLVRAIVRAGNVTPSKHAKERMADHHMSMVDVQNVLSGGWCERAEFENGSWRYRITTHRMFVIVAFRSETELRIVTAARINP